MKKEMLIDSLVDKGWFLQENFLSEVFCLELLAEARDLQWTQAQVGRGQLKQEAQTIRNDSIAWIEQESASTLQKEYLAEMDKIMTAINQELFLGLKEFECHFAQYKNSGFYKKHLDQHVGSSARVISTVFYLNNPTRGGELAIYKKEAPDELDVLITPKPGTLVCFLSNQIYHEVLPTESERFSLTGWFRNSIR